MGLHSQKIHNFNYVNNLLELGRYPPTNMTGIIQFFFHKFINSIVDENN